jgi:hypothetical protein
MSTAEGIGTPLLIAGQRLSREEFHRSSKSPAFAPGSANDTARLIPRGQIDDLS